MNSLVMQTVRVHSMLAPGDVVVTGVSGGADSMALLHFLHTHRNEWGITVIAAHVNHGLRGAEADAEEELVRRWCKENGVAFRLMKTDVSACAKARKMGLEACGRELRYGFFESLAQEYQAKIATAHTLSDNIETLLLHLARGAGLRGAQGILPVRGKIIRPLIRVERAQTEQYCQQNHIPFAVDSSNRSDAFARNRIRRHVLPQLRLLNPALPQALEGFMRRAGADEAYLQSLAAQKLAQAAVAGGYDCRILREAPEPVRCRALMEAARRAGADYTCAHVRALDCLLQKGRGQTDLPGGIQAVCQNGALRLQKTLQLRPQELPQEISPPQEALFYGRRLSFRVETLGNYKKDTKIYKMLLSAGVNYDTISGSIVLRSRQEGDRFAPAGRGVTKTLKNLFQEAGIPPERRGRTAIVECGGEIVWIEGIGVSERAKIREDTQRALVILPEEELQNEEGY